MSEVTSHPFLSAAIAERTDALFEAHRKSIFLRTDRLFVGLMVFQWVAGILAACLISPQTWDGSVSRIHVHVWAAVFLGGAITLFPAALAVSLPGRAFTRQTIAVAQMLMSALLIHLTGGRIETHFHIFGSLAFLAFYRDPRVLVSAALVVVADHLLRGIFWSQSVYGVSAAPIWRTFEHGGWVVFELTFLLVSVRQSLREMRVIAERQALLEATKEGVESTVLERTHELRQAEHQYRTIFEHSVEGIFQTTPEGHYLKANPMLAHIYGYDTPAELIAAVTDIKGQLYVDPSRRETFRHLLQENDIVREFESEIYRKDGRAIWISENARAMRTPEGQIVGYEGSVIDITERKRIERMKTEFISTVSHELRTPLTSIRGSMGLLAGGVGGELPAKARPLVEIALNNSDRLVRLINDILDIEKIESGKMDFRMAPCEIVPLVEQAIAVNEAYGQQLGVRFELGETTPGAWICADGDRFLQVMANLLSNAAKYSPRGEAVRVSVTHHGAGLRVVVTDRGPGIPEEFRSRIFGRFAQADSSDTRQKGGTGLGLSIARAIVEKHGGQIGFDSAGGAGTTFFFDLPQWHVRSVDMQTAVEGEPANPARILICEDDHDIARLLAMLLEQEGFSSDIAHDAVQARDCLRRGQYVAMTMDLMLPGTGGIELVRELRQAESTRDLPIVVISAKAQEGRAELSGHAVGVLDWLDKPIDTDRLTMAVRAAMRRGRPQRSIPRILHVEDDSDIRHVVAAVLEGIAEPVSAVSVQEARDRLEREDFDLVILDLSLPDGSGLALLPLLQSRPTPIPVVIFSAMDCRLETEREVAAVLVKSRTDNRKLAETIRALIERESPPVEKAA